VENRGARAPKPLAGNDLRPSGAARLAVVGGDCPAPVQALVDAVARGFGGPVEEVQDGDVPGADALLVAADFVLFGLPGEVKAVLDGWARAAPRGAVIPKTARMRAGYVATYAPDDGEIPAIAHRQMRAIFSYFGCEYRGRAVGFVPPGGRPRPELVAVAERLGALLAGEPGYAGPPAELLAGVEEFNRGEFWNAHEAWETPWIEADESTRPFFQGLIQVAAALHHAEHRNWGGFAALLRDGIAKLQAFRPGLLGIDLETLLEELEPWRLLAKARGGDPDPVTRRPESAPRITVFRSGA